MSDTPWKYNLRRVTIVAPKVAQRVPRRNFRDARLPSYKPPPQPGTMANPLKFPWNILQGWTPKFQLGNWVLRGGPRPPTWPRSWSKCQPSTLPQFHPANPEYWANLSRPPRPRRGVSTSPGPHGQNPKFSRYLG